MMDRIEALEAEVEQLQAAIDTIRQITVRTVPVGSDGPYQEAGLELVLMGDWDLINGLQTCKKV
jgi:hypothetical protein